MTYQEYQLLREEASAYYRKVWAAMRTLRDKGKGDPVKEAAIIQQTSERCLAVFAMYAHADDITAGKFEVYNPKTGEAGFHGVLCYIFEKTIKEKWHVVNISFRGSGKTTVFGQWGFEWLSITAGKYLRIPEASYITASATFAAEVGDKIKATLEYNPRVIRLWGILKGSTWNKDAVQLTNGMKLYFHGFGDQTRGPHPAFALIDDIESRKSARSIIETRNRFEWFHADFLGQLSPGDPLLWNGTNCGAGSVIDGLMHDPSTGCPKKGYTPFLFKSCTKAPVSGTEWVFVDSLWPSKYGPDELKAKHTELGDWAFDSEMQGEPHGLDEPLFSKESITENMVEASAMPPHSKADVIISYDPAFSKKNYADFTGYVEFRISLRREDYATIYVEFADQFRFDQEQKADHILARSKDVKDKSGHLQGFAIEKETIQRVLLDYLIYRSAINGIFPNLIGMETEGKDKTIRASSVQGLVTGGRVKFIRNRYAAFIDQLIRFAPNNDTQHDDMVDAFVYGLKVIERWYTPKALENIPAEENQEKTRLQSFVAEKQRSLDPRNKKKTGGKVHPIFGSPI